MAQVTKYAGSVNKSIASIVGILLSAFARWAFYRVSMSREVWIALPLVVASTYMHSKFPHRPQLHKVTFEMLRPAEKSI